MKPTLATNYRLERLQKLLNYELSGAVLFFISFFFGFAYYLLAAAIIIFTPYLLFVLYREQRYGWIAALIALVIIPGLIVNVIIANSMLRFVINYGVIGVFFFYCFVLKLTIPEWIDS